MVSTSLVMVSISLVKVSTSLVTVATSLVMVETPEALLGVIKDGCRTEMEIQWKFKSMTNLPAFQLTNGLTWVGARDTCVSKNKVFT